MIPKKIREEMLAEHQRLGIGTGTRIYGYIKPRKNGEFTLNTYALNVTKTYGVRLVEVNRAWSDKPYYLVKNLWRNFWGGAKVSFNEVVERPGQESEWYNGKWGVRTSWKDGGYWFRHDMRYMNPEALRETRYRYCAFDPLHSAFSLVPYVALYRKYPEIEHLSKAGLHQFVNEWFLAMMRRRKDVRDFFRSNAKKIAESGVCYTVTDVVRAHANGWTIEKAHEAEYACRAYGWAPKGIDRVALHRYLTKNGIGRWDYRHYIAFVRLAKMDVLGYGVAFPRDFHAAVVKVHKRIERARAKEERLREEELKRVAQRVNSLIERMKDRLAWRVGEYKVVVPQTRREFEAEGRAMRNCIGGYFEMCADGDTACFFIRKDGRRFADVEMSPKDGTVRQCRLFGNGAADNKTLGFAKLVARKILPAVRTRKAA